MTSIGYGGKGKKSLVDAITSGDYVSDKQLEHSMNIIMRTNKPGMSKYLKTIGHKAGRGFAKHL